MMNKQPCLTVSNPRLREEYRVYHHQSGLDIYIFPKQMRTSYVLFGTKYGSIHNRIPGKDGSEAVVPDGIAHFLEHKLFTCEDGSDAFERFSDYGADANAYTSFNKTCYLFSCTDRFEESLSELLDFVTHPYFTDESVASEVGIIAEEIRMYEDNPSDRCYYGMLEGMYAEHSIRRNICGTVASISAITKELLYDCYHTYYRLSNMALVVCGNVSDEVALSIADRMLPKTASLPPFPVANENDKEKEAVHAPYVESFMQLSKPIFNIGFKDVKIPRNPKVRQRRDAAMSILDEMLFTRSGELYQSLIEQDLISPALSYGYTLSQAAAYHSIAGEADDPKRVLAVIMDYIEQVRRVGLSRDAFTLSKRVMYSEFVKSFDSTESIANNLFSFVCEDCDLLSFQDVLESVTFSEVCDLFASAFQPHTVTLSVVRPLSEKSNEQE